MKFVSFCYDGAGSYSSMIICSSYIFLLKEEVQEEIGELLENVPDLSSTFNILDKIGAGLYSS